MTEKEAMLKFEEIISKFNCAFCKKPITSTSLFLGIYTKLNNKASAWKLVHRGDCDKRYDNILGEKTCFSIVLNFNNLEYIASHYSDRKFFNAEVKNGKNKQSLLELFKQFSDLWNEYKKMQGAVK